MGAMRPPAGSADRRPALVLGTLAAVAAAAVLVFFVVRFAARNPDEANLGPTVVRFDADRLGREIAERGPFLFKDPLTRAAGRELYVQHLGRDPERGWTGIRAYASRVTLECLLRWDGPAQRFVDPCTGVSYPADGTGLVTYPATVQGGTVTVDLRPRAPGQR